MCRPAFNPSYSGTPSRAVSYKDLDHGSCYARLHAGLAKQRPVWRHYWGVDRHFSWASRCVPALESGEWLNIYWITAKAPISSCQVHALHNSDGGIRRPRSRWKRTVIQCATDAPVSFRRGMAACRSFKLALKTEGFSRNTITRPYPWKSCQGHAVLPAYGRIEK